MRDQQRMEVDNLYTFGEGQLSECMKEQGRRKFPFMHNAKLKKLCSYHKIVSQQRSTLCQSKQTIQRQVSCQEDSSHKPDIRRIVEVAVQRDRNIENINLNTRQHQSQKKLKKLSLPKVFKEPFSSAKRDASRRKTPCSEKSMRYPKEEDVRASVRPFASQEYEKQQFGVKPKSLLLLSSLISELPGQKFKEVQNLRGNFRRATKSKSTLSAEIVTLDPQISHNIRKLKRIYH